MRASNLVDSYEGCREGINADIGLCIVQGALEWLEQNQDKPLDEIKASANDEDDPNAEAPALKPGEEARSLVCNECGKKFRSQAQAEFHASKT